MNCRDSSSSSSSSSSHRVNPINGLLDHGDVEADFYDQFLKELDTPEKFLEFIEKFELERRKGKIYDYITQFIIVGVVAAHLTSEHPEHTRGYLGYLFGFRVYVEEQAETSVFTL